MHLRPEEKLLPYIYAVRQHADVGHQRGIQKFEHRAVFKGNCIRYYVGCAQRDRSGPKRHGKITCMPLRGINRP